VADFSRRRFGAEAYDWLIEPLLSGIYAGNGEDLSLESTFPQLHESELRDGSLLKPLLTARIRPPGSTARAGFVTLPGGLGALVEALTARLTGTPILTGLTVKRIRQVVVGRGYRLDLSNGDTVESDAVVLATPAYVSAAMVDSLDPALAAVLLSIPFVSTATVSLAFARSAIPAPLDGYGYVSPRIEGGPLVACTWTSNKFPGRSSPDTELIRCFVGRAGLDEIVHADDSVLLGLAREELRAVHGIIAPPLLSRVVRWPRGMPQYTLGHRERFAEIAARITAHPGLHLAGASYRGVGIPDCIASGWTAAEQVAAQVGTM
jgi:oxygen-dependent protoporphyrinogen oxidase